VRDCSFRSWAGRYLAAAFCFGLLLGEPLSLAKSTPRSSKRPRHRPPAASTKVLPPLRLDQPLPPFLADYSQLYADGLVAEPPPAPLTDEPAPLAGPLPGSRRPGSGRPAAGEPSVSCRPDLNSKVTRVLCTDGKVWTMRAAGLILPPQLRCSTDSPECCQVGFRSVPELQLADLLRVGEGEAPVCHIRVQDFLTNPPATPAAYTDRLDDELPPGLRATMRPECPAGLFPTSSGCQDPRLLVRLLRPPELRDPNRPLVPEATAVVDRLRREFDSSGQCPQSVLDVEVLQRIFTAAQLRAELAADSPLDVAPLLARAQAPGRAKSEPLLPVSCGYNATTHAWYQTTFHCASPNLCFSQSQESLPHTCVHFDRALTASGGSPYFWPTANCQNVPSCIAVNGGPCTGVARLTALGQGVFLMIQEDPSGTAYYYGVLFARRPPRVATAAKAARRARELLLDMGRSLDSEAEQTRLRKLIESLPE
jgi:hypothetical protein